MKQFLLCMLFIFSINLVLAQNVSGTVTDNSGAPLFGVNISEKGTSKGVVTDFDGKYSISVTGDAILIFSYVGYNSQEVEVNNQSIINITLEEGVSLDEIVLVGSRSPRRTATDTAVPVDVLNVADIASSTGKVE